MYSKRNDIIEIFNKDYDGESICDVHRDVLEAFDEKFNDAWAKIPSKEHGIPYGNFSVKIIWHSEQE